MEGGGAVGRGEAMGVSPDGAIAMIGSGGIEGLAFHREAPEGAAGGDGTLPGSEAGGRIAEEANGDGRPGEGEKRLKVRGCHKHIVA